MLQAVRRKAVSRIAAGVGIVAAAVVLILVPFFFGNLYIRSVAMQMFIFIALAVSYQLVFGYARLASFGHVAFYGVAAYTSGVLTTHYGMPHLATWVIALAVTLVLALIAAGIVIRLEPLLLAITTLALAVIAVQVVSTLDITGGQNGLILSPLPAIAGIDQLAFNYWFVAAGMVLIVAGTTWLVRSPLGRLLAAVGDDPVAARALGINANRVLIFVFVLGSGLAGAAGLLLVQATIVLAPENLNLDVAVVLLAMVAVGGLRSIAGAVIGAAVLTVIPQVFASVQQAETLIYGLVLLVVFLVSPSGLVGLGAQSTKLIRRFGP
jgi:branched-chain amino acid transport system permease protein